MPYPQSVNGRRQKAASDRDVAIAQRILANSGLYQRLSLGQRAVLMKRVENPDWSWAQIGEALGLSKTAAWARWQRSMAVLEHDQPEVTDPNLWNMGC
jgi:DNA-binding transcriptional regulator WhiA